jgi:hypothetical protein
VGGHRVTCTDITPAWEFVNFGVGASGDATTLNPALPSGWQEGDLLLVFHSTRDTTFTSIPNTPSGYTSLAQSANMRISGKIATSSESAPSCSYTGGAGDTCLARMAAIRPAVSISMGDLTVGGPAAQLNSAAQNIDYSGFAWQPQRRLAIQILYLWKADDAGAYSDPYWSENAFLSFSTAGNDASQQVNIGFTDKSVSFEAGTITVTGGTAQVSRAISCFLYTNPSKPQKFTISATPAAISAGSDVRLWKPARYAK